MLENHLDLIPIPLSENCSCLIFVSYSTALRRSCWLGLNVRYNPFKLTVLSSLSVISLFLSSQLRIYRILHGKCARTVFTHDLWRIRNRTSERSERVRFLIQNNECVNTVHSTFHVVLCLLYTY